MRTAAIRVLLALCGIACTTAHAQETCVRVRTFAVDPVELLDGRETTGDAALAVVHGIYNYHFVSPANKAKFEKHPAGYEVQLGGACARMGPLSGYGRGDIYAVHDSRIYLFASKQCRETFLKDPDKLLERDDPAPTASDDQRKRGMELIELAVKHAGGPRIDSLKSYREGAARTEKHGETNYRIAESLVLVFPDSIRREESWNDWTGGHVVVGEIGWGVDSKNTEDMPLAGQQVRALRRIANRHPLSILRARRRSDFIAAATGSQTIGTTPGDKVAVYFDGCRMTLVIDPANGRLLANQVRMRSPAMTIGDAMTIFTDERTVDGVTLPCTMTTEFDGKKTDAPPATLATMEIDPKFDPMLFQPPKPG